MAGPDRRRRGGRAVRRAGAARRRPSPLCAGVGHQALGGPRGARSRSRKAPSNSTPRRVRPDRPSGICSPTRRDTRCTRPTSWPSRARRRIYSNYGFAVLAEAIEAASAIEFGQYLSEAVLAPLGMTDSSLVGGTEAAGYGATSTVTDLVAFAGDLLRPSTVSKQTHIAATDVQFPGLNGVLPGFGQQRPNDWGLGFEIRDGKSPHWTGSANSGAHLWSFWPVRDVFVGGSRRGSSARGAHRPQLRRLGLRPVACGV